MRCAKVLARALLCYIFTCMLVPIIVVADWDDTPTKLVVEEHTIEEIITEEVITETTEPTEEPLIDTPILYSEVGYICPVTIEEAIGQQESLINYIETIKIAISSELYSDTAVVSMEEEAIRLNEVLGTYQIDIDRFNKWLSEYPEATEVWFYLRKQGFNEAVTAGIIGNMMIETSGGTLNLKPEIYGVGHYGLCQWSLYYRPNVAGMSLQEQMDYLMSDIEYEFNTFGFCYKSNFNYEKFLQMTDTREAAIAFAKSYERPGAGTYNMRANSAEVAYNYFVVGE